MYRVSTPKSYQAYFYADPDCTTDVPPVPSKLEVAHRYQTQLQRKKQEEDNEGPVSLSALSVATIPEADSLAWGSVHKMWSMIRIDAPDRTKMGKTTTYVDFVVVIDHSASMKTNNKLAFVQATIEYLISKLDETHRFCLIQFNQEVSLVTEGLLPMSTENKETVRALLHEIRPQGTTNISDALFTAVGILSNRVPEEQSRISSIMLFTDGLSNVGLRGRNFMDAMKDMVIPPGLTINTFGYGLDHDSKMLQNISFSSKGGVYYYIENVKTIPATFGECLAGILSTVAHNIEVRLIANDGCRIVNFYTKFPIKELKSVKEYGVSMGSMYSQESRTLLFKLSLRKMEQELSKQPLVQVVVSYTNTLTGVDQIAHASVIIGRPKVAPEPKIPVELDKQINRYTAAAAIEEAIKKASTRDFFGAQKQLKEVIEIVQSSASAKDPASRVYCEDLVEDLKECAVGMEDMESFSSGIHYAHSYSTMYYMERSTGSSNLMGVKKSVETTQLQQQQQIMLQEVEYNHSQKRSRNHGYGYVTYEQGEEASRAVEQTAIFVPGYLDNAL